MTINLPNIVTVIRILLVPLFIIYLQAHLFGYALIVFAVAAISDGLDGFFARFLNQRTSLGAHLDPVADKLLLISAYVSLAILDILPQWLTVLVISRDVLILLGFIVFAVSNVKIEVAPSRVSKCTTVFQLLTVSCALFNQVSVNNPVIAYMNWLYIPTAFLTVISGLHYTYIGLNYQQAAQNGGDE